MKMNDLPNILPTREEMERAFARKDASYDGVFYVSVKTTGIFCRPSCPSRPNLDNVEFFLSVKECFFAGYRPCKRCHPLEANGKPPEWVQPLISRVEAAPDARLKAADLRGLGITPERARRWFQQHYGMSFAAWCRGNRLAGAFTRIRQGAALDDAIFDSGFESHSGFREAFSRVFGEAPGRSRENGDRVVITMLETPLGPLLAGATDQGINFLEYTDRRMLEYNLKAMHRRFGCAIVPGQHPLLERLRKELNEYFQGGRQEFTLPLASRGTPFQDRVWQELRRIPYGQTISYDELARRIGQPTAQRAVARANGMNYVAILIPCHRVIGKDGSLTGYGGGLWRKRLLLELERTGRLPGRDENSENRESEKTGYQAARTARAVELSRSN
jgi:AraC family transcriptional regulator of adaptative response/methylated-DNA-[protein]-cysteine methyltransferase